MFSSFVPWLSCRWARRTHWLIVALCEDSYQETNWPRDSVVWVCLPYVIVRQIWLAIRDGSSRPITAGIVARPALFGPLAVTSAVGCVDFGRVGFVKFWPVQECVCSALLESRNWIPLSWPTQVARGVCEIVILRHFVALGLPVVFGW